MPRREQHGAGFAAGVELAAGEREGAEGFACGADGVDFSVGGWIVGRGDGVGTFADDLFVAHNDRRERAAFAGDHVLGGEGDGASQEVSIW